MKPPTCGSTSTSSAIAGLRKASRRTTRRWRSTSSACRTTPPCSATGSGSRPFLSTTGSRPASRTPPRRSTSTPRPWRPLARSPLWPVPTPCAWSGRRPEPRRPPTNRSTRSRTTCPSASRPTGAGCSTCWSRRPADRSRPSGSSGSSIHRRFRCWVSGPPPWQTTRRLWPPPGHGTSQPRSVSRSTSGSSSRPCPPSTRLVSSWPSATKSPRRQPRSRPLRRRH